MTAAVAQLRAAADAIATPASEPQEGYGAPWPIWERYYADADARSAELRAQFPHELALRYGEDPRQLLDVYAPAQPVSGAPVLVFFHGGALSGGHPRHYGYLARPYLERGAVVAMPSYRLMSRALAEERERQQREEPVFVHELGGDAPPRFEATRRGTADAAVVATEDARAALAWIAHNAAAFGGDPGQIVVAGHSAGAMLAVSTGGADDWQQPLGVPQDVVKAIVPIGGRYGLWAANAIVDGQDPIDPPHDWRLRRAPAAAVVFGEQEGDGEGRDDPERLGDCARIGRTLVAALRERGADVAEVALPPCGHWQTVDSLGDEQQATVAAVSKLLGI